MRKDILTRRAFLGGTTLTGAALSRSACKATWAGSNSVVSANPVGELAVVPVIRPRAEWKQFIVLVWQFQNDVRQDGALYDAAGLHGFHIDRGVGEEERVRLSLERRFPYYVDHAAGKGILFLQKDVQAEIDGGDGKEPWMESLFWRQGNRYCLAVLKNVFESAEAPKSLGLIDAEPKEITIRLTLPVRAVRNVRTGKAFGNVSSFADRFDPSEANLYTFAGESTPRGDPIRGSAGRSRRSWARGRGIWLLATGGATSRVDPLEGTPEEVASGQ